MTPVRQSPAIGICRVPAHAACNPRANSSRPCAAQLMSNVTEDAPMDGEPSTIEQMSPLDGDSVHCWDCYLRRRHSHHTAVEALATAAVCSEHTPFVPPLADSAARH